MDSSAKSQVISAVVRQFPELRGASPSVSSLPGDKYQLIFHGKAKAADGKMIARTVRVVADDKGKIVKLSTSR